MTLVVSMMLTLFARLYYVQLLDPDKPTQTAHLLHDGYIVVPAARGLILDARGRPLVENTSTQQITVDRELLSKLPDKGRAVLARLAGLLGTTADRLGKEITPRSPQVPPPRRAGPPPPPGLAGPALPAGAGRDRRADRGRADGQRAPGAVRRRGRADGHPSRVPAR